AGKCIVSLVAEVDGAVVGHILFSPVTLEGATVSGLGLAPVAVRPAWQRKEIGSRLTRAGLEACRGLGVGYVVVLGWPKYYPRFGFQLASRFELGNEYGATDSFMVLELQPGCLAGLSGIVRYAPEFGMLGSESGDKGEG